MDNFTNTELKKLKLSLVKERMKRLGEEHKQHVIEDIIHFTTNPLGLPSNDMVEMTKGCSNMGDIYIVLQEQLEFANRACQDFSNCIRETDIAEECLGNFDKKTVGKHTYAHWHNQKY